jgi:hypothetical protein
MPGFAGHADGNAATTNHELTSTSDHLIGAGKSQCRHRPIGCGHYSQAGLILELPTIGTANIGSRNAPSVSERVRQQSHPANWQKEACST